MVFQILSCSGEILKIHRHALETPDGVDYEDAAVLDPICNAYKSIAQQSKFLRSGCGRHRHWPTRAILRTNGADYGAVNIVVVGLQEDGGPLPGCKELGATAVVKWFYRRCGGALPANLWQRQSGAGD